MILSSRSNLIASILIVALVFTAVGGYVFLTNQYVPPQVAVVVTEPGFGDHSMADQVLEGLENLAGDITVNYTYRIAADADAAQSIMEQLASSRGYDLIVVVGQNLEGPVQTVSAAYPNQKFAMIGGSVSGSNVVSATFAQQQAAFIAGVVAAFVAVGDSARSGIVGIIGSRSDDPTVQALIAGFTQGLEDANETYSLDVRLLPAEYVGSYNDSSTAYSLALDMYDPDQGNATIIFAPVRASIMGLRLAMEYANITWFSSVDGHREPFAIAAEGNQDYIGLENPEIRTGDNSWIVTSVVPRTDLAVYRIINETLWNRFDGGDIHHYNLTDGNVNITNFEFSHDWITPQIEAALTYYYTAIFEGTIIVSDGGT
jgi:basic membrane protein A